MAQIRLLTTTILLLALIAAGLPANAESWIVATRANNIHCSVGDEPGKSELWCEIFRRTGPLAQPKPADCTADWGHAYFIGDRGPVQMLCGERWSGNWPADSKFETGETSDSFGLTCEATRNTLECRNLDGHGFFLSRKTQKVF